MEYTQLKNSYKYETIAEAIFAREIEHFHYDFDRVNFEFLIGTLPEGEYSREIASRLAEVNQQMANVQAIIAAIKSQIDDPAAYAEAVERVTARRNAKEQP